MEKFEGEGTGWWCCLVFVVLLGSLTFYFERGNGGSVEHYCKMDGRLRRGRR